MAMNDFSFEQAVDRLGQGMVIGISNTADRWCDFGFGQPLCVFYRQILRPAIRMVNELVLRWSALMNGLFQGIQYKTGSGRAAHAPTDDPPGEYVDDEGDIDEPLPPSHTCIACVAGQWSRHR